MIEQVPPRRSAVRRWTRWNGIIFIVIGICWLALIPIESGSRNVTVLRWILGVSFLAVGIGSSITAINQKRTDAARARLDAQNPGNDQGGA